MQHVHLMSEQEVRDFAKHMVQLASHAGLSLTNSKRCMPPQHQAALEAMMTHTRAFYRAAKAFTEAVSAPPVAEEA